MRLVLHIGMTKTGSTAIQSLLVANRARLARMGVHHPDIYGEGTGQRSLEAYLMMACGEAVPDFIETRLGLWTDADRKTFFEGFPERLNRAFVARDCHTVLLTSEGLSLMARTPEHFDLLRQMFEPHFDEISILIYIRRQEDRVISRYSQTLRGGRTHTVEDFMQSPALYDTLPVLTRWADQMGEERMNVRLFERDFLTGGDVVTDFFAQVGVDVAELSRADRMNRSLWPEGADFLIRLNRLLAAEGKAVPFAFRLRISDALDRNSADTPKLRLTRTQVAEIRRRAAPQDEAIRARFFPDRATLFPERPLPEEDVAALGTSDEEAMVRVALMVLRDLWPETAEARRLAQEAEETARATGDEAG